MKWIKNTIRGQIHIGIILAIGGAVGGSIMWVYGLITPIKESVADNSTDIAVLQEAIKCLPEIKGDIKATNENLIKLMASMRVEPVKRELATSTIQ